MSQEDFWSAVMQREARSPLSLAAIQSRSDICRRIMLDGYHVKKPFKLRKKNKMPTISTFYGIRITINWDDHTPPHFHAYYAGFEAMVEILNVSLLKGFLPKNQLNCVLAWCGIHQAELMQNWELARDGEPLVPIRPLQ